ncbi:MAG: hypothetical protein RL760_1540 [Candidatus Eisenbacteria bacterium]
MPRAVLDWLVYWTPRLFCIAFAAFLCVFALDVFAMPLPPLQKAAALIVHLIPAGIVVAGLVLVWRHEWVGATFFPLLAAVHLFTKGVHLDVMGALVIELPLLLLGALFWVNWRHRAQRNETPLAGNGGHAPQA